MKGVVYTISQQAAALPAAARQRLDALHLKRERCRANIAVVMEALDSKGRKLASLKMRRSQSHPDDRQLHAELDDEIAIEMEGCRLLDHERDIDAGLGRNIDQTLAAIEIFLGTLASGTTPFAGPLRAIERAPSKPQPGETLIAAINRVRTEIAAVKMRLAGVVNAPPTRAELEAAVDAYVADLVAKGQPSIVLGGNGKITIAMPDVMTMGAPSTAFHAPSGSASALLAARDPKGLRTLILSNAPTCEDGISAADRTKLRAQLDAQLLALEHAEEDYVRQALASGVEVHRRADVSGWALLGLTVAPLDETVAA
jgi:hypothetical protein